MGDLGALVGAQTRHVGAHGAGRAGDRREGGECGSRVAGQDVDHVGDDGPGPLVVEDPRGYSVEVAVTDSPDLSCALVAGYVASLDCLDTLPQRLIGCQIRAAHASPLTRRHTH